MRVAAFWFMTTCSLDGYRRFGGHTAPKFRALSSLDGGCMYPFSSLLHTLGYNIRGQFQNQPPTAG